MGLNSTKSKWPIPASYFKKNPRRAWNIFPPGSTVWSAGSALGYLHKIKNLPKPTTFIVQKLQPYKATMLRALYLLLFHAFLRIGEAKASPGSTTSLLISDISTTETLAQVILQQYKHSRFPHLVELRADNDPAQCPVQALKAFIAMSGRVPGPLFTTLVGHPYSASTARADLQKVLAFCRLDTGRYNSHSFQIGAASHAASRGFSDAQIHLLGRWRSDAFCRYIHLPY